jgi:hypothetical protein
MKYTAVFDFENEPTIKASDSWLGGKLCVIQFSDALDELNKLEEKMEAIQNWYDTDGSVEELSQLMDE